MKRTFLAVALCLAISSVVRAEIMVATSVEWLTCNSEVVVVGKIKQITTINGAHSVIYEDCVVEVSEVLKGDIKDKQITFCLRTFSLFPTAKALMNSKDGVLFFLSTSKENGSEAHLNNKLVPSSEQFPLSIVDLSNPPKNLFNMKFMALTKGEDILRDCRSTLTTLKKYQADNPKQEVKRHYLKVPFETDAYKLLYSDSACYLYVPDFMSKESKSNFY